ncbi:MAG: hypothetical protein FD146_2029 [Anaerolineaceae bacterium]|nr:MAG: hypothetical protein FD146_2029 [Anaerolineaceae bacterium]
MTPFALWTYRLPFIIFLASAVLLIVGWILKWPADPPAPPEGQPDPPRPTKKSKPKKADWRAAVRAFAREHTWTLILAAVILAVFIFLLAAAPPRLTGQIPASPAQPGRPFYSLRWLRATLSTNYALFWTWSTLLCSLVSLAILAWAAVKRSRFAAQAGLLAISLTLAALGQWMLGPANNILYAKIAYGTAILGFVSWAFLARKRVKADLEPAKPPARWLEITFLVGLFALTAYARLYAFPAVPYGIEGDEAKWTAEAVNIMLDGRPDQSGEYHRDALPVSYYLESAFFHIFGAGIFAARLEVIVTSILATLVFYVLLRQIAPFPLAMLGSFLLSVSIFDISASRLANVESHVKLWPILTLALLALAFRKQRWQVYALAGASLALGLLTYDTVWPLALVALILGVIKIVRHKDGAREKAKRFAALIFPSVLAAPLVVPYFVSRITYYSLGSKGWDTDFGGTLLRNLGSVVSTWFVQGRSDFLYNRTGPLLNAALLPWLALGFVVVWFSLRRRFSHWMLAWALLFLLPVPVLANSQMGRVVYPALPAVYALAALGMFLFWNEAARLLGNLKVVAAAICLGLLLWLPMLNLYIYFNEVTDAVDRQSRREISDIAAEAGGTGRLLLLPVVAGADEPLANEYQVIEMSLHGKMPVSQIPAAHLAVPYDEFLPTLLSEYTNIPYLEIVLDKTANREREQRDAVYAALMKCFPGGTLTPGIRFDRFTLDLAARENPACLPVTLDLAPASTDAGADIAWSLSRGAATEIRLECHRRLDSLVWVEAEQFAQANGWRSETAYVTGWSGSSFLMDTYGSQSVTYTASLPGGAQGYVWVRYFKRAADNSPAALALGSQSFIFASSSPAWLNAWVWERIGPYRLSGPGQWTMTRPYAEDPRKFMALFVDALVFTTDPLYDPLSSASYEPLPEQSFSMTGLTHGVISIPLPPGHYQCRALAVSSQPLVDALGNSPVSSQPVEFDVAGAAP